MELLFSWVFCHIIHSSLNTGWPYNSLMITPCPFCLHQYHNACISHASYIRSCLSSHHTFVSIHIFSSTIQNHFFLASFFDFDWISRQVIIAETGLVAEQSHLSPEQDLGHKSLRQDLLVLVHLSQLGRHVVAESIFRVQGFLLDHGAARHGPLGRLFVVGFLKQGPFSFLGQMATSVFEGSGGFLEVVVGDFRTGRLELIKKTLLAQLMWKEGFLLNKAYN